MKRSNLYAKADPQIEAKSFYIFCEGAKRETQYFRFFRGLATQINLQIVPIAKGKNAPMGLYDNACTVFDLTPGGDSPEYELLPGDEVWFIIDTDAWKEQVPKLRTAVARHKGWVVAQSNPCFEVWLYYHFHTQKPTEEVLDWKAFLNTAIPGGFNSTKHHGYAMRAMEAAAAAFSATDGIPDWATTEVFRLIQSFRPFIEEKLKRLVP